MNLKGKLNSINQSLENKFRAIGGKFKLKYTLNIPITTLVNKYLISITGTLNECCKYLKSNSVNKLIKLI